MGIRTTIRHGDVFTESVNDSSDGKFAVESPVLPKSTVAQTADFTATADSGVVTTMSGSTKGLTGSLPAASTTAGQSCVFRTASQHVHLLSGTFSLTGSAGTHLNLGATTEVNHSVVLFSDGARYLVLASTGSIDVVA